MDTDTRAAIKDLFGAAMVVLAFVLWMVLLLAVEG